MKKVYKYTPAIILLVYVAAFLGFKSPDKALDRVISGDGKGYYAYLPAIFIYKDLQFNFTDQIEYQYYQGNPSGSGDFRYDHGGKKADKFFPGMAIIWLPFFLFGHFLAYLEVFPMDGYSLPYQYAIALSALLFLWLGAKWLRKLLLRLGSGERAAAFITITVTLGTNLLYYTVIEPSMTHVYSFALITGFAYYTYKLFHEYKPKWFVKSLLLFILIILVRPANALVILLVPIFAGSTGTIMTTFRQTMAERYALIRGLIQAIILLAVPFLLWYLQTGKPVIYSYGPEKLRLLHPHMLNILFSFNRGWLVYTPVAFVSLAGFVALFRNHRLSFFLMAGFMVVFVYVSSCWWDWSYNSQCGQRVFIDIYLITALLVLALVQSIKKYSTKWLFTSAIVFLIALNLLQFFQYANKVFPSYPITRSILKDSFFSLSRKAKVYIPVQSISGKKILENDMEQDKGPLWMNPGTRNAQAFHLGQWSSRVDKKIPYSVGLETRFDSLFTTANRIILVHSWVLAPREVEGITLVVDFQSGGTSLSYNQFTLDRFVRTNKWTPADVAFYVPRNLPGNSTVKVYFFNPSPYYEFYIDDLSIDFVSLKDEESYRKLDGVNPPK